MLSVILITHNNEDGLARVLAKVAWADEVIIVDDFSEDGTVDIGKRFGAKVYQKKWEGYSSQKKYALTLVKGDWILSIDSDEVLDEDLAGSISDIVSGRSEFDGYMIKMVTYFLNRPLKRASRPFYQMRLFKKNKARLVESGVHEHFEVPRCGIIERGLVRHYTSSTLKDRAGKIDRYSTLEARETIERKDRVGLADIALRPAASFFKNYVINLGFTEGLPGFFWSAFVAMERFLVYSKAYSAFQRRAGT